MFEIAFILIAIVLIGNIVMFVKNVKASMDEKKEVEARLNQKKASKPKQNSNQKNKKKK